MNRNARRPDGVAASSATPPEPAPPAAAAPAAASQDVVLLGPPTADGEGVHVLRAREERVEAGELRALREGQPVTGEVVSLQPREGNPRICDVKDSFHPSPPSHPARAKAGAARKGPAQVASQAYRERWDEIFAQAEGPRPDPRTLN